MNGFSINTEGLSEISQNYFQISDHLSQLVIKLREVRTQLAGQQGCCDAEYADLMTAIQALDLQSYEVTALGKDSRAICTEYEIAERKSLRIVRRLRGDSLFHQGRGGMSSSPTPILVDTPYRVVDSLLLQRNRLPSEIWLVERMLNTLGNR